MSCKDLLPTALSNQGCIQWPRLHRFLTWNWPWSGCCCLHCPCIYRSRSGHAGHRSSLSSRSKLL